MESWRSEPIAAWTILVSQSDQRERLGACRSPPSTPRHATPPGKGRMKIRLICSGPRTVTRNMESWRSEPIAARTFSFRKATNESVSAPAARHLLHPATPLGKGGCPCVLWLGLFLSTHHRGARPECHFGCVSRETVHHHTDDVAIVFV